jgi:hypothetical protein
MNILGHVLPLGGGMLFLNYKSELETFIDIVSSGSLTVSREIKNVRSNKNIFTNTDHEILKINAALKINFVNSNVKSLLLGLPIIQEQGSDSIGSYIKTTLYNKYLSTHISPSITFVGSRIKESGLTVPVVMTLKNVLNVTDSILNVIADPDSDNMPCTSSNEAAFVGFYPWLSKSPILEFSENNI